MSDVPLAVFDTNVIVSGFVSALGPPGRIVEWLRIGDVRAGMDDRILGEYDEVLHRPELALPPREVDIVLKAIIENGCWARTLPEHMTGSALPDPDDLPFLECAAALTCGLVTGNTRHYPPAGIGHVVILTPRQFVERLR